MAVDTVENTTKTTGGRSQRKRASRSKPTARKAARRSRISNANLRTSAEQVLRQRKGAIDRAHDWTGETRTVVSRRFARVRLPRRSDFRAIAKANPLVLGAVGLGIGMILASIVPKRISARWRTRTISRLAQSSQHGHR